MSVQARHTEHVPEWKVREVEDLVERISSSPVVGLVGLTDIPAKQIQDLRGDEGFCHHKDGQKQHLPPGDS